MALKASSPLEDEVDGRHFSYHEVKIQVKALFNNLGGYQNGVLGSSNLSYAFFTTVHLRLGLAKAYNGALLSLVSFAKEIPGVEQIKHWVAVISGIQEVLLESKVHFLGPVNGVTDNRGAATTRQGLL
jgi:hypothetical protein